jgi:hypothetical protein
MPKKKGGFGFMDQDSDDEDQEIETTPVKESNIGKHKTF